MSKTEQQLADELDAFLTAKLAGKPLPLSDDLPQAESKLAAELLELANRTTPDPTFAVQMEKRLARTARQANARRAAAKQKNSPDQLTIWQEFTELIRRLKMKRTVLALGTVAAVFAFAIIAWTALNNRNRDEAALPVVDITVPDGAESTGPTEISESTEDTVAGQDSPAAEAEPGESEEIAAEPGDEPGGTNEPSELALLPRLEASQGGGGAGIGGGGGVGASAPPIAAESAMIIAPDFSQVFAEASFVLNTTLPLEPATATVLQRTYGDPDLADVRQIADRFGFTGPIYEDVMSYMVGPMISLEAAPEGETEASGVSSDRPVKEGETTEFVPPKNYHLFDGQRSLHFSQNSFAYLNRAAQVDYQQPVANAVPIAEAFLLEHGLIDFPYVIEEGFGNGEVYVYRLVDGNKVNDPEVIVQVANNGEVALASNSHLGAEALNLGSYPLISAEQAWQLILDDVVGNNISFNIMPEFNQLDMGAVVEPPADMPQFWFRQYQPGMEAHLYTSPAIYRVVSGDGPPRIDTGEFVISGSDADLQAIADQVTQAMTNQVPVNIHLWGQISADGVALELAGWEAVSEFEYVFREGGVIQRTADQVLFSSAEGETFILPDAPADLADGLKVNVFAPASRDAGLAYPVLDWQNIDEWYDYRSEPAVMPLPEPAVSEEAFVDPYSFTEVTINEVSLAYQYMVDFEGYMKVARPPAYIQPTWLFSGQTNNGDKIELRVQAVSPEYLQAP